MEETGCKIKVVGDFIATAKEYRGDLHQTSDCYCAEFLEDTGVMALTNDEVVDRLEHEQLYVERVIEKIKACEPLTESGKSITETDVFLLETWRNVKLSCSES